MVTIDIHFLYSMRFGEMFAVFTEGRLEAAEWTGFLGNCEDRKPFTADSQISLKQHVVKHR